MQKFFISIVVVLLAQKSFELPQLGNLIQPVLTGQAAADALLLALQGFASDVSIKLAGSPGPIQIGTVGLPGNLLCNSTVLTANLLCHICSADCSFVHNKYGGSCAIDPVTPSKGYVCVCNDNRPADGNIPSPTTTCGPIIDNATDPYLSQRIAELAVAREYAVLCSTNSVNCAADCNHNHQYFNGVCEQALRVPQTTNQTDTEVSNFCICS